MKKYCKNCGKRLYWHDSKIRFLDGLFCWSCGINKTKNAVQKQFTGEKE